MKELWRYILQRFQLIPLSILVASDVIVISRIADLNADDVSRQLAVFGLVILYLFSNRVGDDRRDRKFDEKHHPERAIQQGRLSLQMLERMGYVALALMLLLAYHLGTYALFLVIPVWLFSLWAKHDFSLPEDFKQRYFFVYNFLNMLQMLVLQVFIYISLIDQLAISGIMWIHIAFVFVLSLQVEVTRKVKPSVSSGGDLYSDHLGMSGSLWLWGALGAIAIVLSSVLASQFNAEQQIIGLMAAIWALIMIVGAAIYFKRADSLGENIFWLAMILTYVGQNIFLTYA